MSIFLFSLFDCSSFSIFFEVILFVLAGIDLLICRQSTSKFFIQFFELCFRTCPALFFYFVEQKNVSLYLILPLFQLFV